MHVPTGGGRGRSGTVVVVVTSADGHGSGAAGRATAGTSGRAGPVVRGRRAAQLELAVLLDRAEDVGDGERRGVRGVVVVVVVVVVVRFGAQGHGQVGAVELRQQVARALGEHG